MSKSVGYYTACQQGQALVALYGDRDLDKLPQVDQSALVAILGLFIYYETVYPDSENFQDAALDAIHTDCDETTDDIQDALACLEGIDRDGAIGVLQFLMQ
jgi:hypothetical protein